MKVAVIGCGNMASKVVELMHANDKKITFFTYTPSETKAIALAKSVNGIQLSSLDDFDYDKIDFWLIGCKPQQVKQLSTDFNDRLKGKNIVSMLAATSVSKLEELFKSKNILRIMPNTPIGLSHGITLTYIDRKSLASTFKTFLQSLAIGNFLIPTQSEKQLDELTVFSGSGPAYVFYFAYTFEQKLVEMGYSQDNARKLINHLFVGSSMLMEKSSELLSELIDQVTSKGGVTIEAIKEFKSSNLIDITSNAIDKALVRTDEIIQELK
jgi:pyrroline-5-carboxylate reductase